jgi:hypothetical protein
MRRDRINLGQDYRLRYSRPGLYRVRALSWRVQHSLHGKTRYLLRVEWREEDSGEPRPEVEPELIEAAELMGPWDDQAEKTHRERVERLRSAVNQLRDAVASSGDVGLGEVKVELAHGKVVVKLDALGGETLARLIEKGER